MERCPGATFRPLGEFAALALSESSKINMDRNPGMRPPFRGQFNQGNQYQSQFQKNNNSSFYVFQPRPPANPQVYQATEFDGKRLRKAIARKTVDYNSSTVKLLESRVWQRDSRDSRLLQPDVGYYTEVIITSLRFVHLIRNSCYSCNLHSPSSTTL